jgi:hypothetical protein
MPEPDVTTEQGADAFFERVLADAVPGPSAVLAAPQAVVEGPDEDPVGRVGMDGDTLQVVIREAFACLPVARFARDDEQALAHRGVDRCHRFQ